MDADMEAFIMRPVAPATAYADVEALITNVNCRENFIHRDVCVSDSECFAHGTDEVNKCTSFTGGEWKWPNHAVGVVPHPRQRKTANFDATQKHVWAYVADVTQADAANTYNEKGALTTDQVLSTNVNQLAVIANVNVDKPTGWFQPGANNTNGCGQMQTWDLPFGYKGKSADLTEFHANLQKLKAAGTTITLTMGSWCTSFPVNTTDEWADGDFDTFVSYFRGVRSNIFGNALDGIDFDWEGFCHAECLLGECSCGWDDKACGDKTPMELAAGVTYTPASTGAQMYCYVFPTHSTFQVMTGISAAMKKAGFVVTLVPMSTSMYNGDIDMTANKVLRNEYVENRKQTINGAEVDLLKTADGILLQWYSGFDAGLCQHAGQPGVPKMSCACNNIPDKDYPNVLNTSDPDQGGQLSAYWTTQPGIGGNMWPATYPARCQACGKNVTLPDGTYGAFPCSSEEDAWFVPAKKRTNGTSDKTQEHIEKYAAWVANNTGKVPTWWIKDMEVGSKCPRAIDCPDFRYEGEDAYASQIRLLKSISQVVDLSKVSIGFESMGTDVQVQYEAYEDPALPYGTAPFPTVNGTYYEPCTQNMTADNIKDGKRCGRPLNVQEWGPKFSAKDIMGLEAAVKAQLGVELAGIGLFTLDGAVAQEPGKKQRKWYCELCKVGAAYGLKPTGPYDTCSSCPADVPTPAPGPGPSPSPGACECFACGSSTPAPFTSGTCSPASGSCGPSTGSSGCYTDCSSDCSCGPKTCSAGPAPGPSPAPSGDKYTCDFSAASPVCKIDPTGWGSKADCTAVCHA
jgi:hypothetical protein